MAKVDLKAKAKECLEFNKLENVVIVVEDGTCFLNKAESHAVNYANSKGLKKEVFTREDLILDAQNQQAEKEAKLKEGKEAKQKANETANAKLKESKKLEENEDSKSKEDLKPEEAKNEEQATSKKATTTKKSNTKKSTK